MLFSFLSITSNFETFYGRLFVCLFVAFLSWGFIVYKSFTKGAIGDDMWQDIVFGYVCPTLGCIMSAAMYGAPVNDLRKALIEDRLGSLNPIPWAVMTGNCLGWCAYGYYSRDPFILASNIPGLVLSFWLNIGAAKLQYSELRKPEIQAAAEEVFQNEMDDVHNTNNNNTNSDVTSFAAAAAAATSTGTAREWKERYVFVHQEVLLLQILILWMLVLVIVGWLGIVKDGKEKEIIGIIVNINLVFFYGAPLQTMKTVIVTQSSESIHVPTMIMNWFNTSFWLLYGIVKLDPIIYLPNMIGLFLGIVQGILCLIYSAGNGLPIEAQPSPLLAPLLDTNATSEEEISPELLDEA